MPPYIPVFNCIRLFWLQSDTLKLSQNWLREISPLFHVLCVSLFKMSQKNNKPFTVSLPSSLPTILNKTLNLLRKHLNIKRAIWDNVHIQQPKQKLVQNVLNLLKLSAKATTVVHAIKHTIHTHIVRHKVTTLKLRSTRILYTSFLWAHTGSEKQIKPIENCCCSCRDKYKW